MHPLILQANKCSRSRRALDDLIEQLPESDDELDAVFAEAVERRASRAFGSLVLAAFFSQRNMQARHLEGGFTLLEDPIEMYAAPSIAVGDVAAAMMVAGDARGCSSFDRAMSLWIIAEWCTSNDRELPPRYLDKACLFSDQPHSSPLVIALLLDLTTKIDNPRLSSLIDKLPAPASREGLDKVIQYLTAPNMQDFEEILDALPDHIDSPQFTMRRATPKVGRNEPCPCGSGRKYKKCCMKRDQERLSDSSDIPGVTRTELMENPESYLDESRLFVMDPVELAALDPAKVAPELRPRLLRRLNWNYDFAGVIRCLEVTGIVDENPREEWLEALLNAMIDCQYDAYRKLLQVGEDTLTQEEIQELGLRHKHLKATDADAPFLREIESKALAALDGSQCPYDLAYDLVGSPICPALGVWFARAVLALPEALDSLDADWLFENLLDARSRLGLAASDPISESMDILSKRDLEIDKQHKHREAVGELRRHLHEKDSSLRDMQNQVRELEAKLRTKEELLEAEETRFRQTRPSTEQPQELPDAASLRHELNQIREELKERHNERNQLRRQVAQMRKEAEQSREVEKRVVEAEAAPLDDDFQVVDLGDQPLRIPVYSSKFRDEVRGVPKAVGARIMLAAGALAAGQEHAFRSVKRLKARHDILRFRVGDYRGLFKVQSDELHFLDVFHRRELEARIRAF